MRFYLEWDKYIVWQSYKFEENSNIKVRLIRVGVCLFLEYYGQHNSKRNIISFSKFRFYNIWSRSYDEI